MRKRIYTLLASGLILAAVTGAATACGAGGSSSKSAVAETTAAAAMAAMPNEAAAYDAAPRSAMGEYATNDMVMETAAEEVSVEAGGLSSGTAIQPVVTNRKLIRTVNLNVETTEFDKLLETLTQTVTGMGGYIEQSDISGNSISDSMSHRFAYLTARVPSDKLDGFIAQVDENGNITNKSENTQDVTLQYSDIESRKKTLALEQDRLWDLLAKADSMDAVIALESRLSEIRYQLESLESQLRTFDNQVDYSSVYLSISEVKVFTPTAPDSFVTRIQKGFSRNLQNVGNGAVNFTVWLISSLPVLIVLAVIAGIIITILHHLPRRKEKDKTTLPSIPSIKNPTKDNNTANTGNAKETETDPHQKQ